MKARMKQHDDGVRPGRAAGDAIDALSEWIDSAQFPIHSRLPPERELALTLRLSRGKVREALSKLEMDGRIWRHVGLGTFVGCRPASVHSTPESLGSATTLTEILEARSSIEPIVARLAALRAELHELNMIKKYFGLARKSASWSEWEKWDELFHRAVAEASGNGILISSIDQLLRIKMHPRWTVTKAKTFDPALIRRYSDEHFALLNAITSRDPEGAEAAMKKHMLGLSLTIGPVVMLHN
jgi:DNA-binding FadR family transcriptional regulator